MRIDLVFRWSQMDFNGTFEADASSVGKSTYPDRLT